MQWENPVEKSNVLTSKNKNSFHIVDSSIATKTKLPAFMPRMELLEVSSTPLVSQVYQMQTPGCPNGGVPNHVMVVDPLLANSTGLVPNQLNVFC